MERVPFDVRSERPEDAADITRVHDLAFGQPDEGRLVEAIRKLDDFDPELSIVALDDGAVVGHALLSRIGIRGRDRVTPALALAPVAVLPDFQSRGIGTRVTEHALARAQDLGHEIVIVIGHSEYYPRFGFEPARPRGLEGPFPVSDEFFMVCELTDGALRGVEGMVEYSPPFAEL